MVITLGQQYNGEKPTVILYTYINRHAGTPTKGKTKFSLNTSSNNKNKSNPILETSTAEDHDDENLHNPETVQDAVIHLEVDEEQWAITQGSKRQARWVWSPRTMSGLLLPDTPHAQHQHNDPRVLTGNKRRSISS